MKTLTSTTMAYNRFQYWVKGPRLKKLHKLVPIQDKIRNGDFDWPEDVERDYLNQKAGLEKRIKEFEKKRGSGNIFDLEMEVQQTFKTSRVTLVKVQEELHSEEFKRLQAFREELEDLFRGGHDKGKLWEQVLDSAFERDCKDTMEYYLLYVEYWQNLRKK